MFTLKNVVRKGLKVILWHYSMMSVTLLLLTLLWLVMAVRYSTLPDMHLPGPWAGRCMPIWHQDTGHCMPIWDQVIGHCMASGHWSLYANMASVHWSLCANMAWGHRSLYANMASGYRSLYANMASGHSSLYSNMAYIWPIWLWFNWFLFLEPHLCSIFMQIVSFLVVDITCDFINL